jgi:hypothetical protein
MGLCRSQDLLKLTVFLYFVLVMGNRQSADRQSVDEAIVDEQDDASSLGARGMADRAQG